MEEQLLDERLQDQQIAAAPGPAVSGHGYAAGSNRNSVSQECNISANNRLAQRMVPLREMEAQLRQSNKVTFCIKFGIAILFCFPEYMLYLFLYKKHQTNKETITISEPISFYNLKHVHTIYIISLLYFYLHVWQCTCIYCMFLYMKYIQKVLLHFTYMYFTQLFFTWICSTRSIFLHVCIPHIPFRCIYCTHPF